MTITFQLPPEIEAQLRAALTSGDSETARRLVADAAIPVVESLLQEPARPLTDAEFEALADELADVYEAAAGGHPVNLSDYAVSREGIYDDHA